MVKAKKSFGKGIDAIFGSSREEKLVPQENLINKIEEFNHESPKESKYVKACVLFDEELFNKFKAVAHWERLTQKELINNLLEDFLAKKGDAFVSNALNNFQG